MKPASHDRIPPEVSGLRRQQKPFCAVRARSDPDWAWASYWDLAWAWIAEQLALALKKELKRKLEMALYRAAPQPRLPTQPASLPRPRHSPPTPRFGPLAVPGARTAQAPQLQVRARATAVRHRHERDKHPLLPAKAQELSPTASDRFCWKALHPGAASMRSASRHPSTRTATRLPRLDLRESTA